MHESRALDELDEEHATLKIVAIAPNPLDSEVEA